VAAVSEIERVLGEFADAWTAGRRPDVDEYLTRVPEAERDELADQIGTWLELAPTPQYDAPARATIAREPVLRAALAAAEAGRAPIAARLPALRERAGLAVGDVARRLVALFGVEDEERAARHLANLERGALAPDRLSNRLLDALQAILGAELTPSPPAAPPAYAFFRSDDRAPEWVAEEIDALSRAAFSAAPEPMDELDRLFLGGPDA
jgi:transcriptional regulator with XRE-family HTH domain